MKSSTKSTNNSNLLPTDLIKSVSYQWYADTDKFVLPTESLNNKHDNTNGYDSNGNHNGVRKIRQYRSRKSINMDLNSVGIITFSK